MENEDAINQTIEILSCNRQQTNLKFQLMFEVKFCGHDFYKILQTRHRFLTI